MIRSMYTAISGVRSNQTRMDVIGNNIANANTTAFKRQRASFAQLLGQRVTLGHADVGRNVNPAYVGLGVAPASIASNFSQGALQNTGILTDLALNGDGFFLARDPQGKTFLTRAGNFTLNHQGELVTTSGLNVQGWKYDPATGEPIMGKLEPVKIDFTATSPPARTQNISISGNLSADISATSGATPLTLSAIVYDDLGKTHTLKIELAKTGDAGNGSADTWTFTIRDAANPDTELASGTLEFDASGRLTAIDGTPVDGSSDALFTFSWDMNGDGTAEDLNLNFGGASFEGIRQYSGSSTPSVIAQDGHPSGELSSYIITQEGVVRLSFTNGVEEDVYRLAIGTVNNVQGLAPVGANLYELTAQAGTLQIGRAGVEIPTTVAQGTLEMSNVDLINEFTDMIVTQRGYQASARIISTSDEMLQEALQIKR